ncbi:glutamate ABC transporter substrate-binding protein [Nocardia cyriacigeorgica]|uniref:glutamate ABC transporter substrate-binding protein n=1 Tax=Nocardia cyriacigeorgica TaxID=135487 RepID=UPI0013B76C10|nr:glutamate ABC transporter substrate-binding protein [Nocardia cyriacigeorgica]NEW39671.1 glutamate ABC transporter substrate-binding protein [Nocardia cyriacigeorgica]NEW50161.1 glutamate ABC transporter substrate-binding protein [Nocardia cyriacigeorgica]
MRIVRTALVLAAVAMIGGGCATEPTSRTAIDGVDFTAPPLPAQAKTIETDARLSPKSEPDCGDPTASLRPDNAANGPALDAIRARGRLVVGLDAGSNLFSFRDPISGAIVGFDADIAREVARDLLGSPDLIEYRSLSSADREKALQDHSVDLVVKTMTVTCARRERVSFSTVYLMAHQRVLAVKGSGIQSLADLAGKRVCVVAGTTSVDHIRRYEPAATILTVPTWADCLVVLQQRQVDAVSTDDAILAGLAAQDPYTHLVGPSISDEPYAIGISKGNDDLVRFVNGTLARIRTDGTWTRIYDRWLSVLGDAPRPPEPVYRD